MPELPEVETVRRGLEPFIVGRRIREIDVVHKGGNRSTTYAPYSAIEGARVLRVNRRGKFLWFELNRDFALMAHLGMSGQLLIQDKKSEYEKHLRVRIDCGDRKREIRFIDQRTFGWISIDKLVLEGEDLIPQSFSRIAPDLFDKKFDRRSAITLISRKKSAIKRVLLDQRVISGVGNIYADEALWRAKIHPERLAKKLSVQEISKLLDSTKFVMDKALKAGGTSFDELYINVNGESGYFDLQLEAYGQENEPCSRCGRQIVRIAFANRSSHFCPQCQRKSPLKRAGKKKGGGKKVSSKRG
jgi:formamidopyrimidine-DNA glycosylase